MPQTRESGAAGRDRGYRMAAIVAKRLGAQLISSRSNEAVWDGQRIVIKSGRFQTPQVGVTEATLDRVDSVVVCLEDNTGDSTLYRVHPRWYRKEMAPSRSSRGGHVMKVSCRRIRETGHVIGTIPGSYISS